MMMMMMIREDHCGLVSFGPLQGCLFSSKGTYHCAKCFVFFVCSPKRFAAVSNTQAIPSRQYRRYGTDKAATHWLRCVEREARETEMERQPQQRRVDRDYAD
jgi:hypothetical protein